MKSPENHIPSKEDIESAESMMSPKEKVVTELRSKDYDNLLKSLPGGKSIIENLKKQQYDLAINEEDHSLSGKIGDMEVEIYNVEYTTSPGHTYNGFGGTLDGTEISELAATTLYEKWKHIAKLQDKPNTFLGIFKGKSRNEKKAEEILKLKK